MRVVHEEAELAGTVDVADTLGSKLRGVMLRRTLPAGYGLVFPFDAVKRRSVHMVFVFVPIDVIWLVDGEVERVTQLNPWTGFAIARADMIIELPSGAAAAVAVGDDVHVVDE